ncbi:MAG: hypothetical protein LQ352_000108 [Teloschistes flavicans]|nr:MAG: hypothetical protein LQ352_000108 [Teloschistes flavicans]
MPADTQVGRGTYSSVWGFENLHGKSNYKVWIKKLKNAIAFEGWSRIIKECCPDEAKRVEVGEPDSEGVRQTRELNEEEKRQAKADRAQWIRYNQKAWICMYNKLDDEIALQIDDSTEVVEALIVLENHYQHNGFTAKHIAGQKMVSTTLSLCKNDVEKYIQAMNACIREQSLLRCNFPDWWIVSCFIANLEGRYKEFTQRVALKKELPSFEEISTDLRKVDRMAKCESEARAYRAQARKGAQAEEDKKKDKNKNKKKPCSVHKTTNHNDKECWTQHPELISDKKGGT